MPRSKIVYRSAQSFFQSEMNFLTKPRRFADSRRPANRACWSSHIGIFGICNFSSKRPVVRIAWPKGQRAGSSKSNRTVDPLGLGDYWGTTTRANGEAPPPWLLELLAHSGRKALTFNADARAEIATKSAPTPARADSRVEWRQSTTPPSSGAHLA